MSSGERKPPAFSDPLDEFDAAVTSPPTPRDEIPTGAPTIEGYRIVRALASGGMGSVFEANQVNPPRRVAIKVIKAGFALPEFLNRFQFEANVLGMLQHPGIARIYEAGTFDDGWGPQPFFVMEYIEGKPLTDYAEELKLSPRARIELLARACDGIQHAHQKGVIHRDLKPDNILVDGMGQPKILDFGVARVATGNAPAAKVATNTKTQVGQIIGTVPYMSPEQLNGVPDELDTRADVYSLGVIGYQLLTGRLPHKLDGLSIFDAAARIQNDTVRMPSAYNSACRGDLDTIILKALQKEKERRYPSASDLAADIRRYLNDEPITARPPSVLYQIRKFARRNKVLVAATVAVFIALFTGVIAATWQARIASHERDEAETARQLADELRVKAEAETQRATEAMQTAIQVSGVLTAAFSNANPWKARGQTATARDILDECAQRIQDELKQDSVPLEQLLLQFADVYARLGEVETAGPIALRAYEMAGRIYPPDSREMALALSKYGEFLMFFRNSFPDAVPLFRRELEIRSKVEDPDSEGIIATKLNLGTALMFNRDRNPNDIEEIERLARDAYETRVRIYGAESSRTVFAMPLMASVLYMQEEMRAEGEAMFLRAIELLRAAEGSETDPFLANVISQYALAAVRYGGDLAKTIEPLQQALDIRVRLFGKDHLTTRQTVFVLSTALHQSGRGDEAEQLKKDFAADK